jgi:hypothetical protein
MASQVNFLVASKERAMVICFKRLRAIPVWHFHLALRVVLTGSRCLSMRGQAFTTSLARHIQGTDAMTKIAACATTRKDQIFAFGGKP